jgi:WD40 repeat protein
LNADGRRVVSASWDNTLRIWDRKTGACLRIFKGHIGSVNSIALSTDGQRVVSGSNDKTLRIWDAEFGVCLEKPDDIIGGRSTDDFLKEPKSHHRRVMSVTSADGRYGVTEKPPFIVWDLESDTILHTLDIEGLANDEILRLLDHHALFSRDSQQVILAVNITKRDIAGSRQQDAAIRIFDVKTGACRKDILGHSDWVCSMAVSLDRKRLLSGGRDGIIRIWDMETGECLRVLEGHTDHVDRIALTADERRIVSWCVYINPEIRIWDMVTGACLHALEGHSADIRGLTFTPDGKRIISGSLDSTLRIWDIESGACIHVLKGHTDEICSFELSSDGRRILSCAKDQTIRIWDVETGTCNGVFFLPGLSGNNMKTNPELDKLVADFADGLKECYYVI